MKLNEIANKSNITTRGNIVGVQRVGKGFGLKIRGIRGLIGVGEWLFHNEHGRGAQIIKIAKNGKIQMDLDEKLRWFNIEDWHWPMD